MRLRTTLRIISIVTVVLLCTSFVVSLYFRLSTTEKAETFDLYTLIPADASTIVDTDDIASLIQGINEMHCSKEGDFLNISHLFSSLKEHIGTLLDETPHGLSRQMSKMLISFHEPDDVWNQLFYCRLGTGDHEFIRRFIQKHETVFFSPKQFNYKGEEITIYPMPKNRFLACYFGEGFFVFSFQKRLVEQAIDAYKENHSIVEDSVFKQIHQNKRNSSLPATLFVRENSALNSWTEFNLKLKSHVIYLSGIRYVDQAKDSVDYPYHGLFIERFPGDILPASTYFFSKRLASDLDDYFDFMPDDKSLTTCFFHSPDSANTSSKIAIVPVDDMLYASISLENMCMIHSGRLDTIFSKLIGVDEVSDSICYNLSKGNLYLTANDESLSSYLQFVESGQVLEGSNAMDYEENINSLSRQYNQMQMVDMEYVLDKPDGYYAFVPSFFNKHKDFFRNFVVTTQLVVSDGVFYPSMILLYKN